MKNAEQIEWIINNHLDNIRKKLIRDLTPKNRNVKKIKGECFFPIEWSGFNENEKSTDGFGGPAVHNPFLLNTYFYDPLSLSDPDFYFQVDLRKAVKFMIEGHEMGKNGPIDPKNYEIFKSVAAALRHLADKLDDALERK